MVHKKEKKNTDKLGLQFALLPEKGKHSKQI